MTAARVVHVVVPQGIDDPLRPSGGNTYDRRLCQALGSGGWSVCVGEVAGAWPWAGESGRNALAEALCALPAGSTVLVDGLVASTLPEVVAHACCRLRLVVLLHMPLGIDAERPEALRAECEVLSAASAVVTTSGWARDWGWRRTDWIRGVSTWRIPAWTSARPPPGPGTAARCSVSAP